MLIKAASLFTVDDAEGPEMDQGEMVRYLSEMMWFPSAFLEDNISFETIDARSSRVTLTDHGRSATGTLFFDTEGRLTDTSVARPPTTSSLRGSPCCEPCARSCGLAQHVPRRSTARRIAAISPAAAANAAVAVAAERIRLAHDIGAVVRQSVTRMAEVADHAQQARVADVPPALSRQARESG